MKYYEGHSKQRDINPWNKGKLVGQKRPLKLKQIWEIRIRLEVENNLRGLTLFNLGIDSKLRGCDLVKLKVNDITGGGEVLSRAVVIQQKTGRPVRFEITPNTRDTIARWLNANKLNNDDYVFPSRIKKGCHITTRQYARIVDQWVEMIGLPSAEYGTHTMRRTKPSLIYQKSKNLRAIQLLLGHSKLESTVRYLGVDIDDALELSESTET